jgi:hypothetical protein
MDHKKIFAKVIHACPYFASINFESAAWRNFIVTSLFPWKADRSYPISGSGIILMEI